MKKRRKKKEVVIITHQHVDKRGGKFGYPHSTTAKHKKAGTVEAHNRTMEKVGNERG